MQKHISKLKEKAWTIAIIVNIVLAITLMVLFSYKDVKELFDEYNNIDTKTTLMETKKAEAAQYAKHDISAENKATIEKMYNFDIILPKISSKVDTITFLGVLANQEYYTVKIKYTAQTLELARYYMDIIKEGTLTTSVNKIEKDAITMLVKFPIKQAAPTAKAAESSNFTSSFSIDFGKITSSIFKKK